MSNGPQWRIDRAQRTLDDMRAAVRKIWGEAEDHPEGLFAFISGVRLWVCEFEPLEADILKQLYDDGFIQPYDYDKCMRANKAKAVLRFTEMFDDNSG